MPADVYAVPVAGRSDDGCYAFSGLLGLPALEIFIGRALSATCQEKD